MRKNNKIGKRSLPKYNNGVVPGMVQNPGAIISGIADEYSALLNNGNTVSKADIGGIASSATGAVSSMMNAFASPELTTGKKVRSTGGPIQYNKIDYVDKAAEMKNLKSRNIQNGIGAAGSMASFGSSIGGLAGPLGSGIGAAVGAVGGAISSIFGAKKRKRKLSRKIDAENEKITNLNEFNRSDAHSTMLNQEYYDENEDTQGTALYNKGKTPFNGGKATALVGKGETIVDGNTGSLTEVTQGSSVGTDDVPANIKPQDAVMGNKINPRTGNTFAEDIKPLTRMENRLKRNTDRNIKSIADATERLVAMHTRPLTATLIKEQDAVINGNKTPKYNFGKTMENIGEYAASGINELASIAPSMYNIIKGTKTPESVSAKELYTKNPYERYSLNRMAKRRYNADPEIAEMKDFERRQRYATRSHGSEGGINRAMDMAGASNMYRNISNTYARKQNIDNDYIAQEAQMAASLGAQEASNRSNAQKAAYDINARNRALKSQYTQAGLSGFANYAQQNKLNRNRKRMDDMRMRALEKYMSLGMTGGDMGYILNN